MPAPAHPETELDAFQSELDYIFACLHRLGISPDDREDVAQEIFLALRASWSKFDRDRRLRPYLFAITFRIASAYRRKHARQIPFETIEPEDRAPSPHEILESAQKRRLIEAALHKVPLPRRAVLIMHHFDEVPVAEVARALSIPLFTAYARLRKARRELLAAIAVAPTERQSVAPVVGGELTPATRSSESSRTTSARPLPLRGDVSGPRP